MVKKLKIRERMRDSSCLHIKLICCVLKTGAPAGDVMKEEKEGTPITIVDTAGINRRATHVKGNNT